MQTQKAHMQTLKAQLREWNARTNLLAAQAEKARSELKHKYVQEFYEARTRRDEAAKKIKELENTGGGNAWEKVKLTVDRILHDLLKGIAQTLSIFK